MVGSLNLTALLLILPPLPTELRLRLSQQPRCLAAAVCTRSFLPQTPTLVLLPKDPRQPGGHLLRALPGSRMDPGLDQVGCSCTLLYTLLLPFLATAAPAGAAGSCCRSRHLRRRGRAKQSLCPSCSPAQLRLGRSASVLARLLAKQIVFTTANKLYKVRPRD